MSEIKRMDYNMILPLEDMALMKVAHTLWNHQDAKTLMSGPSYNMPYEVNQVENLMQVKVSQLNLPDLLTQELLEVTNLIGFQMWQWKKFHHVYLFDEDTFIGDSFLDKLCWTPQGILDRIKGAKMLINDERLTIISRYTVSCIYCLEHEISEMWNKLPERVQNAYYGKQGRTVERWNLVKFWTYYVNGKIAELIDLKTNNPYMCALERASFCGNEIAINYFLQKLTVEEKNNSLVLYAELVADVCSRFIENFIYESNEPWCFALRTLLLLMNGEQQLRVFRRNPVLVLKCFLHWPWQRFLIPTAKQLLQFLPEDGYLWLVRTIVDNIDKGREKLKWRKVFIELWHVTPDNYRRYLMPGVSSFVFVLSDAFAVENIANVALTLKYATSIEKKTIIFCEEGKFICKRLVCREQWDFLKYLIETCLPSKGLIVKFKKIFRKYITSSSANSGFKRSNWLKFSELLDEIAQQMDTTKS